MLILHSFLSIPLMLSVQCDPLLHASFPSVHAFIMLEGTMNLTGETQPLVEQLMMIKRMQVNILGAEKCKICLKLLCLLAETDRKKLYVSCVL